jgi:hypothetical protein
MISPQCANPDPKNTLLQTVCLCEKSLIDLDIAVNKYNDGMKIFDEQTILYKQWTTDNDQWIQKYKAKELELRSESRTGSAQVGCWNSSCDPGWQSDGSVNSNNCSCTPGVCWACCVRCVRSENQVLLELSQWIQNNPQPIQPQLPVAPSAPSGNNIICCTQDFSGIDASNVNFSNVMNNCSLNIQQTIQNLSQTSTPQPSIPQPSIPQPSTPQPSIPQPSIPQPSTPQPSTPQSNLNLGVKIGIGIGVVIFISVIIIILIDYLK